MKRAGKRSTKSVEAAIVERSLGGIPIPSDFNSCGKCGTGKVEWFVEWGPSFGTRTAGQLDGDYGYISSCHECAVGHFKPSMPKAYVFTKAETLKTLTQAQFARRHQQ